MRVIRFLVNVAAAGAVVVLGGCGDSGGRSGGDAEVVSGDLEGRTFTSTDVRGHDLVAGTEVVLTFDADHVTANAGCNTMFGEATVEDGVLTLPREGLATTLMACPDDQTGQDEWVAGLLGSGPRLALDGERLEVGDESSGMTLRESEQ